MERTIVADVVYQGNRQEIILCVVYPNYNHLITTHLVSPLSYTIFLYVTNYRIFSSNAHARTRYSVI